LIKKSLQLKAQLALVKQQLAAKANPSGKVAIHTQASRTRPTASAEIEELGSRYAEAVVLQTAQSYHIEPLVALKGLVPITLDLHYVSQSTQGSSYEGLFGLDRRCSFEKQFYALNQTQYRLDLPDGRSFAFTKQADGSFVDEGHLGVRIESKETHNFILFYHDGRREYYSQRYLVGMRDAKGNLLHFTYIQGAKLSQIHTDFGAKLELEYNAQGLVSKIQDHSGRTWMLRYGEHTELLDIALEGSTRTTYVYQTQLHAQKHILLLAKVKNANKEEILSLEYNKEAKLTAYTKAGMRYSYTWDDFSTISKEDSQGEVYRYRLDSMGLVSSVMYPDATMTVEQYDEHTHTAHIQTRGGNAREELYDNRGRLLRVSINDEEQIRYTYEAHNPRPVSFIKEGKSTVFAYDEKYNLLRTTHPDGSTQSYTYSKEGQLLSYTDANANITTYTYSPQGQLLTQVNAQGATQKYSYDALGNMLSHTDANGQTSTYSYNTLDQVIRYEDAQKQSIDFSYDNTGKLQSLKDPANRSTHFVYDTAQRLIQKRYPDGSVESYTYHPDSNIASILRVDGSALYLIRTKTSPRS